MSLCRCSRPTAWSAEYWTWRSGLFVLQISTSAPTCCTCATTSRTVSRCFASCLRSGVPWCCLPGVLETGLLRWHWMVDSKLVVVGAILTCTDMLHGIFYFHETRQFSNCWHFRVFLSVRMSVCVLAWLVIKLLVEFNWIFTDVGCGISSSLLHTCMRS